MTTLWVMTVAGVMAAAAALAGRNTVNATSNRVNLERAFWLANGCAARAQATIDATLGFSHNYEDAARVWRALDRAVGQLESSSDCTVHLEATGTRLDVNAASEEMLARLFTAMGHGEQAIALVDALEDWRDSDDVPRPWGAERAWYLEAHRVAPRNGPLADIRELEFVRGFDGVVGFDSVLATDPGRVSLATAPVRVLLAVPGFTLETAEYVAAAQASGAPVTDLLTIIGNLSRLSADSLLARYADIVRVTTPDPDAWLLTVSAQSGFPAVTSTLVRRLVRSGTHADVVESRSVR